ncbi:hypothetical protein OPV22_027470 [Ensete ventricosum]|uniref:Uncharacterized protein n=1 Tax=Ensete ventricosum TaxID=4639 RepID=A0AAV8PVF1_ENSVE|nr:hypothetical protein OPV22_027470 [Ensete ventricosum]
MDLELELHCRLPPGHRARVLSVGCGSTGKGDGAKSCGAGSSSVETPPGILLIGSSNVGKRTLLSRQYHPILLLWAFSVTICVSSFVVVYCPRSIFVPGWAIGKYYTADLSIWTTHLDEEFSFRSMPMYKRLDALVMVFDMSDVQNSLYAF